MSLLYSMRNTLTILSLLISSLFASAQTPVGIPGQYQGPIKHGIAFNGNFIVGIGNQLWSSDGTIAGTNPLKVFSGAFYYGPYCFRELGNKLYFMADDSLTGQELWVTDGTSAGTNIVKDINPGVTQSSMSPVNTRSMYPNIIQVLNGKLYFIADDAVNGRELWVSDGTNAGTQMVKDINPGSAGSVPLPSGPSEDFVVAGNKIYFPADDGSGSGTELWASDGTAAGTQLVKDIVTGAMDSDPRHIIPYMNKVVFSTSDFTTQTVNSVYVSDGTAAGTIEIAQGMTNTFDNAVLGNNLYFSAIDSNGDLSLYSTDGTAGNTSILTSLASESGIVPGDAGKGAVCLTVYNNKLYFRNEQNGSGIELWQSDGTVAGTAMLKDIYPGSFSTRPNSFCMLNNRLYFRADDSFRLNLHYTDGTTAGTVQIPSPLPDYPVVNPFTRKSYMSYPLVPVGSSLYFTNPYDMSIAIYKLEVPADVKDIAVVSTVEIYPNPSQGFINVDAEEATSIIMCDISGRPVYRQEMRISHRTQKIDVQELPGGMYTIITVLHDGTKRYGKFVKE